MSQLSFKKPLTQSVEGLDSLTVPSVTSITTQIPPKVVATHSGLSEIDPSPERFYQDKNDKRNENVKDPVRLYLDDVRRIPVLEPQEQTRLFFELDRYRIAYTQALLALPRVCARLEKHAAQLYGGTGDLRGEIDFSQFKKRDDSQDGVKQTKIEKQRIYIQRWRTVAEKNLDALKKMPMLDSNVHDQHAAVLNRNARVRLVSDLAFSRPRLAYEERRVLRLVSRFCSAYEALKKLPQTNSHTNRAERETLRTRVSRCAQVLGVPSTHVEPMVANLKRARGELHEMEKILTDCNKPLVISIAKSLCKKKQNFLDMIQDGNAGLMLAVQKFRPQLGWRFSTFASNWIKQGINQKLRTNEGPVRESEGSYRNAGVIRDAAIKFSHAHGHAPSADQLFEQSGLSEGHFKISMNAPRRMMSLDRPCTQGNEDTQLGESVPDRSQNLIQRVLEREQSTLLKNRLEVAFAEKLNQRERLILKLRYGMSEGDDREWTLEEVGKLLKITRERVRQIQAKAELKLSYDQGLEGLVS